MMADLTIYGIPQSTYTRSVRMALIEKGVPYTLEPAMPNSETINRVHPFGKMPAMRHGDFALYETSAILRYIDESFDGPRLTPTDVKRRARMEQWMSAINAYYDRSMIRQIVLQYFRPPSGTPDRAVIDKAAEDAKRQVAVLDEALAEGPYLLGAELSLPDLLLCPILFYFFRTPEGEAMLATTKNVTRAGEAIRARKSFTETIPPPPPKRG
jgi:glutathione S-transferase